MFLIAGPCAVENRDVVMQTAETLNRLCYALGITLYFKSSFDKANRTTASARGVGMDEGLRILEEVKTQLGLPIVTDVHESYQCAPVAEVADVLQIPAFLSRQTDLLQAAAATGRTVNIKKGQFMAPWDMGGAIEKIGPMQRQEITAERAQIIELLARSPTAVKFFAKYGLSSLFAENVTNVTGWDETKNYTARYNVQLHLGQRFNVATDADFFTSVNVRSVKAHTPETRETAPGWMLTENVDNNHD